MLVPERARKCVVFLGIKEAGAEFSPRATGFTVEIEDQQKHRWFYLVTAGHVVSQVVSLGRDIWVRINNKDDKPEELEIASKDWFYHPERATTDVAICPISPPDEKHDIAAVPVLGPRSVAAIPEVIKDVRMGVGDEVVITGLFRSHYGQQRNVPITRIGNIAMLNDEPVKTKHYGYVDAYLIEARSIGGLSGSPAFVHLPAIRVMDGKPLRSEKPTFQLYLLGLIHGHFDIEDLNSDVALEDQSDATSGINAGIGVVIPVEKIIETIMQPELIEIRQKAVEEHQKKQTTG
jgi:hypothetical protein